METETAITLSILAAALAIYFMNRRSGEINITITLDEGFPLKDDGVEELEVPEPIVKPKRVYNKRPAPITKINTVAKKPVGRPKKSK